MKGEAIKLFGGSTFSVPNQGACSMLMPKAKYNADATAARQTTAAAMARNLSNPLTAGAADRGAVLGAAGAAGRGATGAALARGAVGAGAGAAAGLGVKGIVPAPLGGSVGSLMVGAADGLGGRLMRTVSFLGWTLPVSFFGGIAPPGTFGILSAIRFVFLR